MADPAGNVYVAKLDEVIASLSLTALRDQIARDRAAIFNNDGNPHIQNTDFNALPNTYAAHYVSNGYGNTPVSNGPPLATASHFYGFTLGLGTPHETSSYSSQIYWPRTGSPYLSVRFRENGSWTSWSKMYAGYADAAPWSGITGKPNTLAGYGITDGVTSAGSVAYATNAGNSATTSQTTFSHLSLYQAGVSDVSLQISENGTLRGSLLYAGVSGGYFGFVNYKVGSPVRFFTSYASAADGNPLIIYPTGEVSAIYLSSIGLGYRWQLGTAQATADAVSNGYVTVWINDVAYKLMTRA